MPFDGSEREWRRVEPERSGPDDNVITFIIIVVAAVLLVMPLTLGSITHIVHYLQRH